MKNTDYTIYPVTDREALKGCSLEDAVIHTILGGAKIIQLREKNMTSREFLESAVSIKKITEEHGVKLIINDRVDIALAVNADGVHLGQSDMPAEIARRILGKDKIIGVTAPTVEMALQAEKDGADYIGVGAMFKTSTKANTVCNTKDNLIKIVQSVNIPVVAIGGINLENAPALADTGISGFAVVSAIFGSDDIKGATEKLISILRK